MCKLEVCFYALSRSRDRHIFSRGARQGSSHRSDEDRKELIKKTAGKLGRYFQRMLENGVSAVPIALHQQLVRQPSFTVDVNFFVVIAVRHLNKGSYLVIARINWHFCPPILRFWNHLSNFLESEKSSPTSSDTFFRSGHPECYVELSEGVAEVRNDAETIGALEWSLMPAQL